MKRVKIILVQDVPGLGQRMEIKEVTSGFARNLLLVKGLALIANDQNLKQLERQRAGEEARRQTEEETFNRALLELQNGVIKISASANPLGNLFAAIHKEEIVEAIRSQKNISLPANYLELPEPLKTVGEFNLAIRDRKDPKRQTVNFALVVEAVPAIKQR